MRGLREGVVAIPVGPMGELVAVEGLSENGGKKEGLGDEGLFPVVGLDFLGGAVEFGEDKRGALVREIREESGGRLVVCENRLHRAIPENLIVRQLRDGKLASFLVATFLLRLGELDIDKLIDMGKFVRNIEELRPRDKGLMLVVGSI